VAARARPNTLLATAFDLKVFVRQDPAEVTSTDVLAFVGEQRKPCLGAPIRRSQGWTRHLATQDGNLMTEDDDFNSQALLPVT
jgi:hypothetical protein